MSFAWPVLRLGARGPEVGNLQRFLAEKGYTDANGGALSPDEHFGARTDHALKTFQIAESLTPDGAFGPVTRKIAGVLGFIPFLQAVSCTVLWPKRRSNVNLIVVHSAECNESSYRVAEDLTLWAAGKLGAPPAASWHYFVDRDSIVQSVRDSDKAWHVQSDRFDSGNNRGIGIEHAGYARQSVAEWSDAISTAILLRSAGLAARLARTYGIPIRWLSPLQVKAGEAGFCGHADVTIGYNVMNGHWDPGPSFMRDRYLEMVREAGA